MVLENYIKEIIKVRGSVIIPGLGAFKSNYKPAGINISEKMFTPPSKEIFFDDKIHEDFNNVLVNYISKKTETSKQEVKDIVSQFVTVSRQKLDNNEHVPISNLGYLYKDKAYKIHFVEQAKENILLDSFGLSEFNLGDEKILNKPVKVVSEDIMDFELTEPERQVHFSKILVPIVILFIVTSLIIIIMVNKKDTLDSPKNSKIVLSTDKSEIQDTGIKQKPRLTENKTQIESEIDSLTRIENALSITNSKKPTVNPRFYLVVGSFATYNNALKLQKEMENQGYETEIINSENRIYRVSIKSFTDKQKALEQLRIARARMTDKSIWLLTSR